MNKPDWKDAPEWANYLAMDSDEEWYWHEMEPWIGAYTDTYPDTWQSNGHSDVACDNAYYVAANTLEKRP